MTLPKINLLSFPESQFYKEEFEKWQIVSHHTASGRGSDGDYRHWLNTPERIATCLIVERNGECAQLFNSRYWGHHIGVKHQNNLILNKHSIGIEIDSWGGLTYDIKDKVFRSYTGSIVPNEDVIEYENSFRGYRFFEKYTDDQIESFRKLLLHFGIKYNIPLEYNENMFDVCNDALNGKPGIWSHTSYRKDKSDVHPQPELIEMLKNLNK